MSSFFSMQARLRPLNLYRLDGASLVDAELAAYSVGIDALNDLLDSLEREAFTATAQKEGLCMRERLWGKDQSALPLSDRREMLLCRGGITPADHTREGVERALAAAGILCSIGERRSDGVLYLNCIRLLRPFSGQAQVQAAAQEFLPAHLPTVFDFRPLSWNDIAQKGLRFDQMDSVGLSWDDIDHFEEDAYANQS